MSKDFWRRHSARHPRESVAKAGIQYCIEIDDEALP
jgi:hypothetical protein